jgi:hypothetical protein
VQLFLDQRRRVVSLVGTNRGVVRERASAHGGGRPGIPGTVTVTVLVLTVTVTVVLVLVLVLGVVDSVVDVVDGVVVVVVVVVVSVVDDGVEVVVAVRDVVVNGVNGSFLFGLEPPNTNQMISARSNAPRAPNRTNAHGLRYHGTGGSPGGPMYSVGCSE